MEQKSKNNSQKVALIATVIILVGALLVAGCLLLTAKSRIVGVWSGGPVYLDYYRSHCYTILSFRENGEYIEALTDKIRIRYRINGILKEVAEIDKSFLSSIK